MYLVTGGAGFIGSNLVAALAERGDTPVVCDFDDEALVRNIAKRGPFEVVPPDTLMDWLAGLETPPEAVGEINPGTAFTYCCEPTGG